ncbi:MAG TPA: hypothetical protein VM689_10535 [Aliidongia sp.]|nr:hypothetical protein [Aliidongia sp.]
MFSSPPASPPKFRRLSLASLSAAEAFYDGPFSIDALVSEEERHDHLVAAADQARREVKEKLRATLRFVRQHRTQARPDLEALMLSEAASYRASFRYWHHRFVVLTTKSDGIRDAL